VAHPLGATASRNHKLKLTEQHRFGKPMTQTGGENMSLLARAAGRHRRALSLAAVGATVALIAAGCGSSSSSSTSSSSGGGSASNAAATTAGANLSAAQAIVAQASQRPTSISVTKPIGKPVPSGKKIVFISCGASPCELQGKIVAQGAALLGWTSSSISTNGTPAAIQAAYETAIRQGADAIVTTAAIRAELEAQIPKLIAKGIPVADASSTDPISPPFIYNTSTAAQNVRIAKYLAAEIVADSKGKANALYVNLPAYTILAPLGAAFASDLKQLCPSCGYATIGVPLTQLANASSLIVSYLRSHPSVNYVALSVADALDPGLPAALSAAGLSHVKIVAESGGPTEFGYVANGQELALVPYDYYSVDYQMLDALARHFSGVPVQLTAPPLWLITKSNLPASHSAVFPMVADYQSQFKKLWGKS
jgi:ribose transport system substrate-binding protein